ncbi:MAG: YggT family protein [Burkholderiales bacterium]|jgi:YggT family protein|nr:YggT family protein [Burkholderiales bacterium]
MLLVEIADFLLQTVAVILGVTLLARAYMNYLGLPARNPLAQFAIALTDWLVRPLRRLARAAGRLDFATLLAAALVAVVFVSLRFLLAGLAMASWPLPGLLLMAMIELLRWALYLVLWLTLLHAVLSWVNPHAPIAPAVSILARPFLAPFQRALPLVGGIDLSPLVVILIVNVMLIVLARSGV